MCKAILKRRNLTCRSVTGPRNPYLTPTVGYTRRTNHRTGAYNPHVTRKRAADSSVALLNHSKVHRSIRTCKAFGYTRPKFRNIQHPANIRVSANHTHWLHLYRDAIAYKRSRSNCFFFSTRASWVYTPRARSVNPALIRTASPHNSLQRTY